MNTIAALTTLNFLMADVRDGLGPISRSSFRGEAGRRSTSAWCSPSAASPG
ncbi:hypothetical protein [Chenggangzhangella methanolivorans]|uniref:hypothetical protein n=1 Tax=Chenggangzhangella methanolivorans TaxID=1437009 RepID=UPI0021BD9D07|nr:hypothetical protein [Chenggangzhangella methanolivorans]